MGLGFRRPARPQGSYQLHLAIKKQLDAAAQCLEIALSILLDDARTRHATDSLSGFLTTSLCSLLLKPRIDNN